MSDIKPKPLRALAISKSDTTNALFQTRFIGNRETTASGGSLTIDNDGDDNTKLLITAVGWDANAAVPAAVTKYYAASAYAAGGADATVVTTLQALIDAIHADNIGFELRRAHGMSDVTVDSDDFIDIAATQFSGDWTNFAFRDSGNAGYDAAGWSTRVSSPEIGKKGQIELVSLKATATYSGGSVAIKVSEDRKDSAAGEVQLFNVPAAATTVETTVFDFALNPRPLIVNSPISIEAIVTTGPMTGFEGTLLYRPAQ